MEDGKPIDDLTRERNRLKQQVHNWMIEQGERGQLFTNSQAPMWKAYSDAETALANALNRIL